MLERAHWEAVYRTKKADSVSWFQANPEPSLAALDKLEVTQSASLVDVGGGASNLVDVLLQRGWSDLTVLDISRTALEVARNRLGRQEEHVEWLVADVTTWKPARAYDVWHDRAVFHFLTTEDQRTSYRQTLEAAIAQSGHVIIATFAPDGPERCSGLSVQRYDEKSLATELGARFSLRHHWRKEHHTPGGASQMFNWCVFQMG